MDLSLFFSSTGEEFVARFQPFTGRLFVSLLESVQIKLSLYLRFLPTFEALSVRK